MNTDFKIPCSLITGQEKIIVKNARHLAYTMETANLEEFYECGVIDEIQMIGDQSRGSAWTKALLGLQVDELHLTGDYRSLELIRHLISLTGDQLIVKEYLLMS